MLKISGVTVLYNPDKEILKNILSYLNQIERLYIIDNSEEEIKPVTDNLRSYSRVRFLDNKNNIGIAAALNKSADQAIKDGYDLLLTMDQDSRISENYVNEMLVEFEKDERIGILTPFLIHNENPKKSKTTGVENITVAMTSGSVINLSALQKIGGYLEKLFIDYVDNEYCLRMNSLGYKVLRLNSVYVYHNLGAIKPRNFLLKKIFPTNHSPLRWYYRTRNRFYVYKKYKKRFPAYIRFDKKEFFKDFLKILIYESDKIEKIRMIILGYRDYRKNRFGKFNLVN